MSFGKRLFMVLALWAFGLAGVVPQVLAHPDVRLKDANGNNVTNGVPYSPRMTCGTTSCHQSIADSYGIGNIYEGNVTANATKYHYYNVDHSYSYNVPYPVHGVTAGYHFQQGRNHDWGDDQRNFYGVPSFTSSGGMWGKY